MLLAIECISVLPLANLQHAEIEQLVRYARQTYDSGQAFQGRSEEKLMHVFRTLGRIAMMPGAGGPSDATGLVPRTEGANFRKEHSDMVLLALLTLTLTLPLPLPLTKP